MPAPSLDDRRFRPAAEVSGGDAGRHALFEYAEREGVVHARHGGGTVRLGFLVGTRDGDVLRFRHARLRTDGRTATGRCEWHVETLAGERLRLPETWACESQPGAGTSAVDEVL